MANQPETATYDSGVYQLETTDEVLGGVGGIANAPLLNLSNRTAWLKQEVDAINTSLGSVAPVNSPAFTGSPTAPTPVLGDSSTKIPTTAFVQNTISQPVTAAVGGGSNVVLTQAQWGAGIITLTGAITAAISVIFPTQGRWIVVNKTTGAFALTCKTLAGSGVVLPQNDASVLFSDGTNVVAPVPATAGQANGIATLDGTGKLATTQIPSSLLAPQGQGIFTYVSGTSVKFAPQRGGFVTSGGSIYQLSAAGISAANTGVTVNGTPASNLAASTVYLVSYNGANGILKFWALGTYSHMPDTTAGNIGVEVISNAGAPLTNETLVGMLLTSGSAQFQGGVLLRSWFNGLVTSSRTGFSSNHSTASASLVELGTEIRNNFLVWAGESVAWSLNGELAQTGGTVGVVAAVSFDNAGGEPSMSMCAQGSGSNSSSIGLSDMKPGLSEGLHYATVWGAAGSGSTATFMVGLLIGGSVTTPTQLTVTVGI